MSAEYILSILVIGAILSSCGEEEVEQKPLSRTDAPSISYDILTSDLGDTAVLLETRQTVFDPQRGSSVKSYFDTLPSLGTHEQWFETENGRESVMSPLLYEVFVTVQKK